MDSPELTDGFHLILDALKLNGIDTIYGVAGIPVTDLMRLAVQEGMRYYGFRHESNACFAAQIAGYLTQVPGVCMTVSGPGFLNGMVAMANATTNCFPMILISGSSERHIIDLEQGDYEELDQMHAAKPYAKASYRVNRPEDIGVGVARAIHAACSGRPGGVYLDIPAAVIGAAMDQEAGRQSLIKVIDRAPAQIPSPDSVKRALDLLSNAKRPLVILGKGAAYAQADQAIRRFIEDSGIPYLPMSMAKGLLPDDHAQCAAAARSYSIGEADVVMLVGARLNWLLAHGKARPWTGNAQLIQLDIAATEMDSNIPIAAPVVGDIRSSIALISAGFERKERPEWKQWMATIAEKRSKNVERMAKTLAQEPSPMTFSSCLRAVRDVLADHRDVYVVNNGANTLDFGRNILNMYEPRQRLDCATWGTMGIGMGFSVGAATVSGKPVVAVLGDSEFGFSGMELETICRFRLPIVVVILNNSGIYQGDDPGSAPSPTGLIHGARYDRLIEAFGGVGYHATDTTDVTEALKRAIRDGKPAVINCVIDPKAGTESGHITNLNPKSSLTP